MNRFVTTLAIASALAAAGAAPALANVPSAANSTVPACMALCPMGDMHFVVTVRDIANNPIAGALVILDFSGCPNAFICPQRPNDPYTIDVVARSLRMFSDASGKVDFPARIGGTGPAGCANVFANGVLLKSYALASPDQNGNGLAVGIVDVDPALFAAKLGTVDPTADFDCSGGPVDAADQLIFFQHLSQSCDGFVDAIGRRTWGSLKQHYR